MKATENTKLDFLNQLGIEVFNLTRIDDLTSYVLLSDATTVKRKLSARYGKANLVTTKHFNLRVVRWAGPFEIDLVHIIPNDTWLISLKTVEATAP